MKQLSSFFIAFAASSVAVASPDALKNVFAPNAPVCVRFDVRGRPIEVAVNGSLAPNSSNRAMLKLLQARAWNAPPPSSVGKWIALSVAPDGSPVPEILPDCSKLPLRR